MSEIHYYQPPCTYINILGVTSGLADSALSMAVGLNEMRGKIPKRRIHADLRIHQKGLF